MILNIAGTYPLQMVVWLVQGIRSIYELQDMNISQVNYGSLPDNHTTLYYTTPL